MSCVKDSSVIKEIAKRNYQKNKLRNGIAIVSIILITLMYTSILVLLENLILYYAEFGRLTIWDIPKLQGIERLFIAILLIFLSGCLIIYNIFQISIVMDLEFYGHLKMVGGSYKQIRKVFYFQINKLCQIGIFFGLPIGYVIGKVMTPIFFGVNVTTNEPFVNILIIFCSLLLTLATVFVSCIRTAKLAGKISPLDAKNQIDITQKVRQKKKRETKSTPVLYQMSLIQLVRNKKRVAVVAVSITIGIVLLNSVYCVTKSFDVDKYLDAFIISDYSVYGNIKEDVIGELSKDLDEMKQGKLYTMDAMISLSENTYENIKNFYYANNGEIIEYMSYNTNWTKDFNSMMESHISNAEVFGIDGLILDILSDSNAMIHGRIDKERLNTGNYVIVQGIAGVDGEEQPTYHVGDIVTIEGRELEIMAIIPPNQSLYDSSGAGSSGFYLSFFLPSSILLEMKPDIQISKFFFNEEKILDDLISAHDIDESEIVLTSKSTILEDYENQIRFNTLSEYFVSFIVIFIGLINYVNLILNSILKRKKQLDMMQNIGLGKRQLKIMFLYEGINYMFLIILISTISCLIMVSYGVKSYISTIWCATFVFTITPLLILIPILILFAAMVPLGCYYKLFRRKEVRTNALIVG